MPPIVPGVPQNIAVPETSVSAPVCLRIKSRGVRSAAGLTLKFSEDEFCRLLSEFVHVNLA